MTTRDARATVRLVHELALMGSVVERIVAQTEGSQILVVRLEIGRLAGVAIDALRFCFEVCARGTTVEGSTLEIIEIGGRARCQTCGIERVITTLISPCACGSFDQQVLSGHELRLKEVEVL